MGASRPSTPAERGRAVAILRANRAAGRPLFAGTGSIDRNESTLLAWLRKADLEDPELPPAKTDKTKASSWPKPFWELT